MRGNTNANTSGGGVKILNVVQTGTLTRDGAVYSGFSSSNYLQLGDIVNGGYISLGNNVKDFGAMTETADSWELVIKFKYKAGGNADMQTLFNMNTSWGSQISVQKSSDKLLWQFSNSSGGSDISGGDEIGNTVLVDGNTYWVKLEFTGTAYQVSLSIDGENFALEKTPTSSTTKLQNRANCIFGVMVSDSRIFLGEIDLEGCYIKANGEYWWKGVETI